MTVPATELKRCCDAEAMQSHMESFVNDGLYDSAQLLGDLLLSLAAVPQDASGATTAGALGSREFHAKSYALFADLMMAKREYKRAIRYYKLSWKLLNPGSSLLSDAIAMKLKIAECWRLLDDPHQAIEMLLSIPSASRTLKVNLLLGKLYVNEGLKNKAEEAYLMALRQNPYALEATLALTSLAANSSPSNNGPEPASSDPFNTSSRQREIEHFYTKLSMSSAFQQQPSLSPEDALWLQMLVTAHMSANRGHYRASVLSYEEFDRVFPENLHSLLHRGLLDMDEEHYHWAHFHFYRARQIDELNLSMMDVYADCLRKNGARTQLNNLVHELFAISEHHAECWLAAAYYSDMKEDQDTALQFCERAIMINRRLAPAHLFRGELLLHRQRPEHALLSFSTASKLTKRLEAYSGMITSYCDLCLKGVNKYKEALTTAKSVVKLFSHKAESYLLLGTVFALRPENKEHARKAFQKALSMEPRKLEAIFGLVDLFVSDGEFDRAIDKLLALSEHTAREEIFTKLADVFTLNKQFAEAMTCYHRSLSLNPSSAMAVRGLDRLEKIMRGEDPDGGNTTLDPDEYDESMEAGEYIAA